MAFQNVIGKIGNMRKVQDWVIYPLKSEQQVTRMIQCENRIAEVNLETGKVMLSDGKGGHQGFMKLSKALGAKEYDCPADILEQLKGTQKQVGPVRVL